jgi:hypothetical protein
VAASVNLSNQALRGAVGKRPFCYGKHRKHTCPGHIRSGMEPLAAGDPPAIGGFRLNARLGFGGMGRVYLGFSPAGRAVAVKVVRPELAMDAGFRRRFHT